MSVIAENMNKQWEALELELLTPLPLAAETWDALLRGRINPYDKNFINAMPVELAEFKVDVRDDMFAHALQKSDLRRDDYFAARTKQYLSDLTKIHGFHFPSSREGARVEPIDGGLFTKPIAPEIHFDGVRDIKTPVALYQFRIATSACQFMKREVYEALKTEQKTLIDPAFRVGGVEERATLGRNGWLQTARVNRLLMMLGGMREIATPHASAPLPPEGRHSVQGFGFGYLHYAPQSTG